MLRIRFGGGAAAGAFTVPLQKFREFLEEFRKKV
jgi:single-stranded DNA-specific DHH superfamily exonuclease